MTYRDDAEEIRQYLEVLATQRRLSPHTVAAYGHDLDELLSFADGSPVMERTDKDIRRFAANLHGRGQSPRSIARKLSAWRGFYQWLVNDDRLVSNPAESVKAPRRSKPLPKALAQADAALLVSTPDPEQPIDTLDQLCNLAMFELLYSSGLRVSELASLDLHFVKEGPYLSEGWIDIVACEVRVTGKGGKVRTVPVGSAAIEALNRWLEVRKARALGSSALFLSSPGVRVSVRSIQRRIKAHGKVVGLPTNIHPHVLRHSFASHVLQSSGDLRAVQELMGHASITSTQIYTALDFQRLAQVYDAAHPRALKRIKE
jgi:integrase/recombinase XerC